MGYDQDHTHRHAEAGVRTGERLVGPQNLLFRAASMTELPQFDGARTWLFLSMPMLGGRSQSMMLSRSMHEQIAFTLEASR